MLDGSCTSICLVERSEALAPVLFCSSLLTSTFIGDAPPSATTALTVVGATGSTLYSGSSSARRGKLGSTPKSLTATGAALADQLSDSPARALRAPPPP